MTKRPRDVDRHALLQPGAGDAAGRGRLARSPPPTTSPRPSRALCASGRQASRSRAATARASSSTRCCSPTSTTRCEMLEAHYADGRRDRHRDEGGLRAADGPVRAARRGRQRRVAGDPARRSTWSSASPASRRRRCSSTWSRRATWAARPGAGSATTRTSDARRGRGARGAETTPTHGGEAASPWPGLASERLPGRRTIHP